MDLSRYAEELREQLVATAEPGGDEARAVAERLSAALEPAVRLTLLDALAQAAGEITRELAPGSVELRLRGREVEFVATPGPDLPPSASGPADDQDLVARWDTPAEAESGAAAGEQAIARINLRLPEQLKARVEERADREGLSINAWLVRAVSAAVRRGGETRQRSDRLTPGGPQRYTGWGR